MGKQGFFTIKQLATRFDISEEDIKTYIEEGLLTPLYLDDGVFFRSSDFLRLEVLEKGAFLGLTLGEMKIIMSSVQRDSR